ncbi:hypothetical protein OEZ85_007523 [Tetradesmus obliquus]|uniref:Peptidase C1A papain C-terminal domain-containing protein n=1 Tax=Tetradesmus obliquus TaxID=3088 RepID=A0ABY8THW0_TETOB|nr:hypothetical protein OEZ85_007523 [Tetradesmus obliquus]
MQRGIYYLAAAAKSFPSCQHKYGWTQRRSGDTLLQADCNNFVPSKPRDQKACSTCVSQSVATAMQMAAAAALEKDVDSWEVNAASMYYCTDGGRSCSTGYEIQQNLHEVIDKAPELIRPSSCTRKAAPKLADPASEPNVNPWLPVCRAAQQACRNATNRQQPWLKCSYTSLSTFWEIQRWIRNHGAVVTRITIYDDFNVQINKKAKLVPGEGWPAYRFNKTAKPLYGHAAVIVGYDNDNFTWTLLNSWGSGTDTSNSRSKGITADGRFRIQMGLAGVGTPDQTYGVTCAPLPGSEYDRDGVRQFYDYKRRLPVEFINPAEHRLDLDVPCFKYKLQGHDTIAAVVDGFRLTMEEFVLKQQTTQQQGGPKLTDGSPWSYENVTYKLGDNSDAELLDKMLKVADDVFKTKNQAPYQPYIQCWHYDSAGVQRNTTCDSRTGASTCLQYGNGTVGCALHYANIAVPETLTGSGDNAVIVCNITHPYFENPRDSQPRALKRLGLIEEDTEYCHQESFPTCKHQSPRRHIGCNRDKYVTYIWNTPVTQNENILTGTLPFSWPQFSKLSELAISHNKLEGQVPLSWTGFERLRVLDLHNNLKLSGCVPIPPQNHALLNYNSTNTLITGSCPTQRLEVEAQQRRALDLLPAVFYADTESNASSWQLYMTQTLKQYPTLSGLYGMKSLKSLDLSDNDLTSTLPASFGTAAWSKYVQNINMHANERLSGTVPSTWSALNAKEIDLEMTNITGCVPDQLINAVEPFHKFFRCSRNNTELLALKALKGLFEDDGSTLQSWQEDPSDFVPDPLQGAPPGPPPYWCRKWVGVTCDQSNQVSGLAFDGLAINSTLAGLLELLQQLPALQSLSLSGCSIAGALPAELSSLANLRHLDLSSNPGLAGTLHAALAGLSFLQTLDVSGCGVAGTLPAAFAALQQLREFRAANSSISGQLPGSWGLLQNLQVLDMSNAQLTGSIPAAWFDSAARKAEARALLLGIQNSTPAQLQQQSTMAAVASAAMSQAVAPLPPPPLSLAAVHALQQAAAASSRPGMAIGLTQLQELRLAGNDLNGSISGIELLGALRVLELSGNSLGGQLPLQLAMLSKLQELRLRSTNLTGPLPDSFARLSQLQALDLAGNNITGTLPEIWVGLTQLRTMDLASNMLSGTLPLLWGRLGAPTHSLQLLLLGDNPCMEPAALASSIQQSGILSSGRVRVEVSGAASKECMMRPP